MPDDAQCLARYARERDAEAFAALVERHAAMVYAACLRVCRDRTDAEDAAQDAFLALAREAGRIRTSLPAWLHAVATNAALRMRRRRRHAPLDAAPEPIAAEEGEAWREALPRIDEALATLPDEVRAVLVLRHLEGRSQGEIAEELGLSQPTVSRRLAEGVQELRRRLHWAGEAGALAVALEGARIPAPATVTAKLGHISLAGPGAVKAPLMPILVKSLVTLAVLAALGVACWPKGTAPAPLPAPLAVDPPRAEPPGPAPTKDDEESRRDAVLARHVTITWRFGRLDRMLDILNGELRSQDGEWLMVLPSATARETDAQLNLAMADVPLSEVLEEVRRQTGYRWRAVGGFVLLDHAIDPVSWNRAGDDLERRHWELAASGDAESVADLLRAFGSEKVDEADPASVGRFQLHLLRQLGTIPMNLLPWEPSGQPLRALAREPGVHEAMEKAWKRTCDRHLAMTPLLCALMGMLRIDAAVPDLMRLVEQPDATDPSLTGGGRLELVARERIRQAAAWSLGELRAKEAAPLLIEAVRREPMAPSASAFIGALGRLDDRAAVDLIRTKQDDWVVWEPWAYEYDAVAQLDPSAFVHLLPPERPLPKRPALGYPIPSGWWDGFIVRPCAEILPQMLSLRNPQDSQPWVRQAFRSGMPRLPGTTARDLVKAKLTETGLTDGERAWIFSMLARLGDRSQLAPDRTWMQEAFRLAALAQGKHPWEELGFVVPTLPADEEARLVAPMLEAIDPAHPSELVSIVFPTHGRELVPKLIAAYPSPDADRPHIAQWLAVIGGKDATDFLGKTLTDGDLAKLWRDFSGVLQPELRARVLAALGDPERAGVLLGAVTRAPPGDQGASLLRLLSALPIKQVTADLVAGLRPGPMGFRLNAADHLGWSKLVLRWLHDTPDPTVRSAATTWLGQWVTRDYRPPCAEALTALCDLAESDQDDAVRAAAKKALQKHFNEGPFPGDGEAEAQGRVLAGSFDDRGELKRIDALAPRVGAAIDAPAPAPGPAPVAPPTKSGDF